MIGRYKKNKKEKKTQEDYRAQILIQIKTTGSSIAATDIASIHPLQTIFDKETWNVIDLVLKWS